MATRKITFGELRGLVKQIINEEALRRPNEEVLDEGLKNFLATSILGLTMAVSSISGVNAQTPQVTDSTKNKIEYSQQEESTAILMMKKMIQSMKPGEMVGYGVSDNITSSKEAALNKAKQEIIKKSGKKQATLKDIRELESHSYKENGKIVTIIKISAIVN